MCTIFHTKLLKLLCHMSQRNNSVMSSISYHVMFDTFLSTKIANDNKVKLYHVTKTPGS